MAKGILKLFGVLLIGIGLIVIAGFAAMSERQGGGGLAGAWVGFLTGGGFLIAGAPLLGFAQVLDLLEEIARNTRPASRP